MHKLFRIFTLSTLIVAATALTAQAQEKAAELSAGILGLQYTSFSSGGGSTFEAATGGAYFSAGFYLSESLALEPILSSQYLSLSDELGGGSVTSYGLALAADYYFNKGWGRKGPYIAPRLTFSSYNCDDCSAQSQFGLGVALGTKVPLNNAAALRLQASFDYGFEGDLAASTAFGASLGLSVFLKK